MRVYQNSNLMAMNLQSENCLNSNTILPSPILVYNKRTLSLSFNKLDKALLCLFIIICNFIEHSI